MLHSNPSNFPFTQSQTNLIVFKLVCILTVIILSILGGIIPVKLREVHYERFLPFLNCFAGGLFVGAGFLHMIPNAQKDVSFFLSSLSESPLRTYPFASLGVVSGLLLTFFIERLLMAAVQPQTKKSNRGSGSHQHGHGSYVRLPNPVSINQQGPESAARWGHRPGAVERPVLPYLMAIVFSLHSFIAGTAFGIQASFNQAIILMIVLVGHKLMEAIACSVVFVKANVARGNFMRVFVVYTAMMPLGIVVGGICGQLMQNQEPHYFLVQGVLESVAAGTFVYVSLLGILVFEFDTLDKLPHKMTAVLLGFAVMAVIAIWF
eukprot:TRINITY_DN4578_c0_g3_i1.p1 TRINITY_DN4578_c0_g3~~TRINITY_DN4578_c0_g3_i1.p1  ORF type:complete len:320 (-),score=91.78 TRINITY_DN4578_c0_g3_i1:368-1327(-)